MSEPSSNADPDPNAESQTAEPDESRAGIESAAEESDTVEPSAGPEPASAPVPESEPAPHAEAAVPPAPPVEAVLPPPVGGSGFPPVAPSVPPAPYAAPGPYAAAPAAPYAATPVMVPVRPKDARRVPWGHAVATGLALVGLVLNIAGSAQFPSNAPMEQAMSFGISIDLIAVIVACTVGFWLSLARPAARSARVFPWIGLAFSAIVFVLYAVTAGGLYDTLFFGGRGRYMNDVAVPFMLGIPWVLGAVFSAYGLRAGGKPRMNIPAIIGLALWAILLAGVVASALLYGADLTD